MSTLTCEMASSKAPSVMRLLRSPTHTMPAVSVLSVFASGPLLRRADVALVTTTSALACAM